MNLRKAPHKHNVGMALPMTLIFLLVGAVLVGTALYVVENMFSTSRHVVTETQLYNAAQSGIEQAKVILWDARSDLDHEEREYDGTLDSVRARLEGVSDDYLDDDLQGVSVPELVNVTLTVDILDCNYVFDGINVNDYEDLDVDQITELPPRWPEIISEGEGTPGGLSQIGSSGYLDPNRQVTSGGGRILRHYVIRSRAESADGKSSSIETLVVIGQ
ncbi:MAG: hypothetical protein GXY80_13880 [Syntrophorhabdus aromaticivorans]|uniref:Type 4 fimbrial biogenesis protein PilX N-terminal domain-containing protein n=1 Tax=Syntrophorhabdus aromaticivorans TaxID=328301 RepID=A0A971M7C3_9BACT|nr:hypothetical protein [Syntrophorhabdus aromaticivorans]